MRMRSEVQTEITSFPLGTWIPVFTCFFVIIMGVILTVCSPFQGILTHG